MAEPGYAVVWPLGKSAYDTVSLAPREQDLSGKTICELWDWAFRGDEVFSLVRELLATRYPRVKFVDYTKFGNIHGPKERELLAALGGLLRENGCDAVISGLGA